MVDWLTCDESHVKPKFMLEDWHKGVIMPLWKGKGDTHDCANHRGFTYCQSLAKWSLVSYLTECFNKYGLPATHIRPPYGKTGLPSIKSLCSGCLLRSTENSRKITSFTLSSLTLRQHLNAVG